MSEKYPLQETLSPIDKKGRDRLNENWTRIMAYFDHVQLQIKALAGGHEVDELIARLEQAIANAETDLQNYIAQVDTTVQEAIDANSTATQDAINANNTALQTALQTVSNKLTELNTAISNAETATSDANVAKNAAIQATQDAQNAINTMKSLIDNFGSKGTWSSTTQFYKNNLAEVDGRTYIALKDNINTPVTDKSTWALFADKGATGGTGPQGLPGKDGKDGTGVTIIGSLSSEDDLPSTGNMGDAYLINGFLYVWNGTVWENVGEIQGPEGKSAYDLAVQNGFVGTTEEWLESLKGGIGPPGPDGPQGPPGKDADLTQVNQEIANIKQTATDNQQVVTEHLADNVRHVTAEDKANWNAMLRAVTVGGSNEDANNPVASAILTSGIAKGAPDSGYWYIFTFTYGGGGGATPNMGQIAIAYLNNGSRGSDMRSRYKFGGEWSTWSSSFHLPTPVNAVLATGWYVNTGEALTYYKDGFGIVHVSGRVRRTDGNSSRRITTLPVGYRPAKAVQSQVGTSITGSGYVDIDTNGNIDVWLDGTTNVNVLINATFTTTV